MHNPGWGFGITVPNSTKPNPSFAKQNAYCTILSFPKMAIFSPKRPKYLKNPVINAQTWLRLRRYWSNLYKTKSNFCQTINGLCILIKTSCEAYGVFEWLVEHLCGLKMRKTVLIMLFKRLLTYPCRPYKIWINLD